MSAKYLMNPATGSVDTDENWLTDKPTWEGDQQAQFDTLIEVASLDGRFWHEIEVFANLMDDDLREELHSSRDWQSEQEFLDAYAVAHLAKFGKEFTIN
jgi:hypothetical protein